MNKIIEFKEHSESNSVIDDEVFERINIQAQDENENWIVTKAEPVNLDATIDSETQTITTPFGTYQKSVEGEENNDSTWKSHTDVNGNKIYVVYNENDGFEYEYDASGKLVMVHEALM